MVADTKQALKRKGPRVEVTLQSLDGVGISSEFNSSEQVQQQLTGAADALQLPKKMPLVKAAVFFSGSVTNMQVGSSTLCPLTGHLLVESDPIQLPVATSETNEVRGAQPPATSMAESSTSGEQLLTLTWPVPPPQPAVTDQSPREEEPLKVPPSSESSTCSSLSSSSLSSSGSGTHWRKPQPHLTILLPYRDPSLPKISLERVNRGCPYMARDDSEHLVTMPEAGELPKSKIGRSIRDFEPVSELEYERDIKKGLLHELTLDSCDTTMANTTTTAGSSEESPAAGSAVDFTVPLESCRTTSTTGRTAFWSATSGPAAVPEIVEISVRLKIDHCEPDDKEIVNHANGSSGTGLFWTNSLSSMSASLASASVAPHRKVVQAIPDEEQEGVAYLVMCGSNEDSGTFIMDLPIRKKRPIPRQSQQFTNHTHNNQLPRLYLTETARLRVKVSVIPDIPHPGRSPCADDLKTKSMKDEWVRAESKQATLRTQEERRTESLLSPQTDSNVLPSSVDPFQRVSQDTLEYEKEDPEKVIENPVVYSRSMVEKQIQPLLEKIRQNEKSAMMYRETQKRAMDIHIPTYLMPTDEDNIRFANFAQYHYHEGHHLHSIPEKMAAPPPKGFCSGMAQSILEGLLTVVGQCHGTVNNTTVESRVVRIPLFRNSSTTSTIATRDSYGI